MPFAARSPWRSATTPLTITTGIPTGYWNGSAYVVPGTPAEGAGIVVGDKITTVEMVPVAQIGAEIVKKLLSSGTVGVGQTVRLGLEKGSVVSVTSVKW